MDFRQYQRNAVRTAAKHPDWEKQVMVLTLGLAGEAGEVVELIKKGIGHGHEIDLAKLEKELGDQLWYLFNLAEEFDIDMNKVAEDNITKLQKRYPQGFTTQASIARVDEKSAA